MPPVKIPYPAHQPSCSISDYIGRRIARAGLNYMINRLEPSSIQSIAIRVVAIFIALATLVVAYLQYKRISGERPAVIVEQERYVPPSLLSKKDTSLYLVIS
ncbi:hypothetical protein AOQ84DRAFT_380721 [Glonium stellatum]|uniref:Uncharacterized protein n=1 Tax=Glonium stellatum TaxID=574774 RepID=A0A8E2ESW9_9PEZI|nr:hypothetical protein AOQ84DRAFT_380721 [Glonium stellatum]